MVNFFFTKSMANDEFSQPPRRADSKIPFSLFAEFCVRVTSGTRRSVSVGFWGAHPWSPFWGKEFLAGGLYRPPLPPVERPPPASWPVGRLEIKYAPPPPPHKLRGQPEFPVQSFASLWQTVPHLLFNVSPESEKRTGMGLGGQWVRFHVLFKYLRKGW